MISSSRAPIVLLAALTFLAGYAGAEENGASSPPAGRWALEFGIGPNLSLSSFESGAISIRFIRGEVAYRVSAGFSERNDETEGATVVDERRGAVAIRRLRYSPARGNASLYLGAGPDASYLRKETESAIERRRETNWSAGIGGTIGAEWRPAPWLGIHGEYTPAIVYGSRDLDRHSTTGNHSREESAGVYVTNGARIGAAVIF